METFVGKTQTLVGSRARVTRLDPQWNGDGQVKVKRGIKIASSSHLCPIYLMHQKCISSRETLYNSLEKQVKVKVPEALMWCAHVESQLKWPTLQVGQSHLQGVSSSMSSVFWLNLHGKVVL